MKSSAVLHRIDDLEILDQQQGYRLGVLHRIDDLEKNNNDAIKAERVLHRIDDLEIPTLLI